MRKPITAAAAAILAIAGLLAAACSSDDPTVVPTAAPASQAAVTEAAPARNVGIVLPTITPAPTNTPAPTRPPATAVPTPRFAGGDEHDDICLRSPSVQNALLERLRINRCTQVDHRELSRITDATGDIELYDILHPEDLAGLVNLRRFYYSSGPLDYIDWNHLPSLRQVSMRIEAWPPDFSFAPLPLLEGLSLVIVGAAACEIFQQDVLERVFGPVMERDAGGRRIDWWLQVGVPVAMSGEYGDDYGRLAADALAQAIGLDLDGLTEAALVEDYGRDWRDTVGAEKHDELRAAVREEILRERVYVYQDRTRQECP